MLRRTFLKNISSLAAAVPMLHPEGLNPLNFEDDIVTFKIGSFNCTQFRDSMFKYLSKDFFINANADELTAALEKYRTSPDNIPSPFISMLMENGDKKILVDTGVGFSEKPVIVRGNAVYFKGRLNELLQRENINKDQITDVIITHFHPDHVGGIVSDENKLNFPNARFHMHADEWNYWHSYRSDNQPEQFKIFIAKNITTLKDRNLNLVKGDNTEMLPGVTAIKADGHTPGQIAVAVQSGKDHLLYISDAFLHPLHIEKLEWQTNYDLDHKKAKTSRIKLLEMAYKDNMLMNAFHFEFPCLGRVDKYNSGWTWKYMTK